MSPAPAIAAGLTACACLSASATLYELPLGSERHPVAAKVTCLEETGCTVYTECSEEGRPTRPEELGTLAVLEGSLAADRVLDTAPSANQRCMLQVVGGAEVQAMEYTRNAFGDLLSHHHVLSERLTYPRITTPLAEHPPPPPKDENGRVLVRAGSYPAVLAEIELRYGGLGGDRLQIQRLYWHVDFDRIAHAVHLLYSTFGGAEVPGMLKLACEYAGVAPCDLDHYDDLIGLNVTARVVTMGGRNSARVAAIAPPAE